MTQLQTYTHLNKNYRTRQLQLADGSLVTVAEEALFVVLENEGMSDEPVDDLFVYYATDEELALSDRDLIIAIYGVDGFLPFDEVTGELKSLLYEHALNEFLSDYRVEDFEKILKALQDKPNELAIFAGRGSKRTNGEDLFNVCELYEYLESFEMIEKIDTTARDYYCFLRNALPLLAKENKGEDHAVI